jgi:predicted HTH domain antitoxin
MDRSELIRRLLDSALQQKRIDDALKAYQDGKVTLWRAAEMSGLSLREMMELAKD